MNKNLQEQIDRFEYEVGICYYITQKDDMLLELVRAGIDPKDKNRIKQIEEDIHFIRWCSTEELKDLDKQFCKQLVEKFEK